SELLAGEDACKGSKFKTLATSPYPPSKGELPEQMASLRTKKNNYLMMVQPKARIIIHQLATCECTFTCKRGCL
ncbi:MAG: hypothetical protein WCK82_11365, partial [Bacteroidota bacterium]